MTQHEKDDSNRVTMATIHKWQRQQTGLEVEQIAENYKQSSMQNFSSWSADRGSSVILAHFNTQAQWYIYIYKILAIKLIIIM